MDAQEANALIAKAGLTDPRLRFNTPQEQSARAVAWAELLGDVTLAEGLQALLEHQRTSTYPPLPVNIIELVRVARNRTERSERVAKQIAAREQERPELTESDKQRADRVFRESLEAARAARAVTR